MRLSSGTNGFTCALWRERACFSASLPLSVSLSVRRPDRIASLLTPSHQSRVNSEIGSTPASRFALTSRDIAFRLSEIQGGIATSCERATVGPCDSDNFQPFPREREREKDDPGSLSSCLSRFFLKESAPFCGVQRTRLVVRLLEVVALVVLSGDQGDQLNSPARSLARAHWMHRLRLGRLSNKL